MTYADLLDQALLQPESERVSLANTLLQSLGVEISAPPLSDNWMAEIERRLSDLDQGRAELLDFEEVMREAEQTLPRPPISYLFSICRPSKSLFLQ